MISKTDLVVWFKELESYKRIDTMCTLLNMCLPFELRFLGTCLEDLGRRDSHDLRGMELRVNNPQELTSDMMACQKGDPTDFKIRRKLAMYVALLRASSRTNRTGVTEIFKTLKGWEDFDYMSLNDIDTLKELLLVYTMASHHPVFSFEQHLKCLEIFEKIMKNKLVAETEETTTTTDSTQFGDNMSSTGMTGYAATPQQTQLQAQQQNLSSQQEAMPQMNAFQFSSAQILVPQYGYPVVTGSMQHPITNESIPAMLPNLIPSESSAIIQHNWTNMRTYHTPGTMEHPPQSSSPMLSQQSSPSSSRTASPNRNPNGSLMPQHQQTMSSQRNISSQQRSLKNVRRPSAETTPPPGVPVAQMSDIILPQNVKNMDESAVMSNEGSSNPLANIIRNGYNKSFARAKTGNYISSHHQPQQSSVNQSFQSSVSYPTLPYYLQTLNVSDNPAISSHNTTDIGMNSIRPNGSECTSPTGSSGETSPPETPTSNVGMNMGVTGGGIRMLSEQQKHNQQISYNKLNMARIINRPEKVLAGSVNSASGSTILYPTAQMLGPEYLMTTGGNAGGTTLMQTSLSNNNNAISNSSSNVASNNNMTSSGVLIGSPTPVANGSNSVMIQTHQQPQFSYYPRPAIIGPGMEPHPGFRYPNVIYTQFPPSYVRNPASISSAAPTVLPQQLPPQAPPTQQQVTAVPNQMLTSVSSSFGCPAKVSCYNCGSSIHNGSECPDASMEEVTRSNYQLNYTVSTSNTSPTSSISSSGGGGAATAAEQLQSNKPLSSMEIATAPTTTIVSAATVNTK